eukprot:713765-Pelagomonas_calceolata.AAC.3
MVALEQCAHPPLQLLSSHHTVCLGRLMGSARGGRTWKTTGSASGGGAAAGRQNSADTHACFVKGGVPQAGGLLLAGMNDNAQKNSTEKARSALEETFKRNKMNDCVPDFQVSRNMAVVSIEVRV